MVEEREKLTSRHTARFSRASTTLLAASLSIRGESGSGMASALAAVAAAAKMSVMLVRSCIFG